MTQLPLFAPQTDWTPPSLSDLPRWAESSRVCIDLETHDPNLKKLGCGARRDGKIVGFGFALQGGPAYYLPIGHEAGGNLPEDQVLRYVQEQAKNFRGEIVGAGLQYEYDYLAEWGAGFEPSFWRDVQVAEPLLDELQLQYGLDAILERRGLAGKDEGHLVKAAQAYGVHHKKELFKLHSRDVGAYAERDLTGPLELLEIQEREIDAQDLRGVYDLESAVLPVLARMRRRGVRIDFGKLDQIAQWSSGEEAAALDEIHRLTGVRIAVGDTSKPDAVAPALQFHGVHIPLTPSTKKPSITADFLATIDHPTAALIRRARKMAKLRTTYISSLRRHAIGDRIHCTFNQLRTQKDDGEGDDIGAAYGRTSSSSPNLQNQPNRDPEIGKLWRSVYLPDEGAELCRADYSQQEPRWMVHYAELSNCIGAFAAAERYRTDPKVDNHQMMADLCGMEGDKGRSDAKELFLGKVYGMGGAKFCHKRGLPTRWREIKGQQREVAGEEGQALLDIFDEKVPFARELAKRVMNKAKKVGYIRTVLGRRCRFPLDMNGGFDWTHKALNRLVQGSSADQTKLAMLEADKAGLQIQLQVHDEIDMSVTDRAQGHELAEIMRECVPANLPFRVDPEFGPNWGEMKEEK